MRRPVLLWGGSRRSRYLPGRTKPPTPADRGAVYVAHDPGALAELLPAILDAHAGRPLTDAEIEPHVWLHGSRSIAQLAEELLKDAAPGSVSIRQAAVADDVAASIGLSARAAARSLPPRHDARRPSNER